MHGRGVTEILMAVNKFFDTVKVLEHGVQVHVEYLAQYFFTRLGVQTSM
jgi:hypothetical protein